MKKLILFFVTILLVGNSACNYVKKAPSPTEVFMSHYEAEKKSDLVILERNLSRDSLKLLKETAAKKNLDEKYLIENSLGISKSGLPEIRNEQIKGNTAAIETKNPFTGDWDKTPFVKEDGKWKIDLNKFIEDSLKRLNDKK